MGPDHTMVGADRSPLPSDPGLERDIRRLVALFIEMRARFGADGPYLFGAWSVPDAFFTPVATRFRHFQVDLAAFGDDGSAQAYCDVLLAQPHFLEWAAEALR
jgi:glutathione S-transferase